MKSELEFVGQRFVYTIDDGDIIVEVSDNWSAFAEANDAPELSLLDRVLNSSLWTYITDPVTSHLYKLVVEKVRARNVAVTIPICCDSPESRRLMEITISPVPPDRVEFSSRVERVVPRDPVAVLKRDSARSEEFLRICSYCKKIDLMTGTWAETDEAIERLELFRSDSLPQLTHSACPGCYEAVMAELGVGTASSNPSSTIPES